VINKPHLLKEKGPILFAANHPNSFLDGLILTTLMDRELHSLARGDAFRHPLINRILRWMKLLPVYRTSEGVENLGHNYTTFDACHKTFEKGGHVLIFSEGRCENEWHLRPLKKGTARLTTVAWQKGIPLRVIPLAFNYSSFKRFGKTVHLLFGNEITSSDIREEAGSGRQLIAFNQRLEEELKKLVYEFLPVEKPLIRKQFSTGKGKIFFVLVSLPAIAGLLTHAPLYIPVKLFTAIRYGRSGHYDSVLHSLLLILYPLYLLMILLLLLNEGLVWQGVLAVLGLPLLAKAWLQFSEVIE
jgi:1-acyl-sn-glycerol-3-phosphate acyltransferase